MPPPGPVVLHTFPVFPHAPCILTLSLHSRTLLYSRPRSLCDAAGEWGRGGQSQPVFEAVPGTGGSHGHNVTKGHLHRPGSAVAPPPCPPAVRNRFLLRPTPGGEARGESWGE